MLSASDGARNSPLADNVAGADAVAQNATDDGNNVQSFANRYAIAFVGKYAGHDMCGNGHVAVVCLRLLR